MRGFNQEMFYGQLLTGVSGAAGSYLDTPLAGTGLSPAVAQGVSFRRIGRGEPVVFDFVSVREGYIADFTRIFALGELPRAAGPRLRGRAAPSRRTWWPRPGPGVTCRALYELAVGAAPPTRGSATASWATAPARCASSATASVSSSTSCPC